MLRYEEYYTRSGVLKSITVYDDSVAIGTIEPSKMHSGYRTDPYTGRKDTNRPTYKTRYIATRSDGTDAGIHDTRAQAGQALRIS